MDPQQRRFDAVVDCGRAGPRSAAAFAAPGRDRGRDDPHLNPSGCRLFAEAVPARLLRFPPLPENFGPAQR